MYHEHQRCVNRSHEFTSISYNESKILVLGFVKVRSVIRLDIYVNECMCFIYARQYFMSCRLHNHTLGTFAFGNVVGAVFGTESFDLAGK